MRNGIGTSRLLIVASLVLPVVALAQPLAGDPASGRKTATALCGTCHQVIGGEGRDSPASFVDIANMTSTTALSLKVFLRSSHKEMPNLIIDSSDTDDLIPSSSLARRVAKAHSSLCCVLGPSCSNNEENLMSRFVVHFMKDVLGENGREQEIRQCTVEVDAASKTEATQLAKQKFCETQGLSDWSDHADRMQVKEGDFPS